MARTKKEIDKDLMYKKLMPSAVKTKLVPQEEQQEEEPVPVPAGEEEEPSLPEEPALPDGPLNPHRPIIRREVGVSFMDTQPTILVNAMEAAVLEKLDSVLVRFKCCRCDRCKKDIVAMALNKLPPKYRVVQEGRPAPDLDPQTNAQVLSAMIQSVLSVRAHPRH